MSTPKTCAVPNLAASCSVTMPSLHPMSSTLLFWNQGFSRTCRRQEASGSVHAGERQPLSIL